MIVFLSHECPISREYVPELNRLADTLTDKPVKFVGVISEPRLTRSAAVKFQKEFKITVPAAVRRFGRNCRRAAADARA